MHILDFHRLPLFRDKLLLLLLLLLLLGPTRQALAHRPPAEAAHENGTKDTGQLLVTVYYGLVKQLKIITERSN
jgi:hypothetical protein